MSRRIILIYQWKKDELEDLFTGVLQQFNPEFKRDWVRKSWLFRAKYAQPVPVVNQSQYIPDLRTPMPGLYLASMSQVYPWDRGTNYAVEIGRRAARLMLEEMTQGALLLHHHQGRRLIIGHTRDESPSLKICGHDNRVQRNQAQ